MNNIRNSERNNVSIHRELCGPQRGHASPVKQSSSVTPASRRPRAQKPRSQHEGHCNDLMPCSCRSQRAWHAQREAHRNLGDPCRRPATDKRVHTKPKAREDDMGVGSLHSTLRTGKPATRGRERQGCAARKGNMMRTRKTATTMRTSLRGTANGMQRCIDAKRATLKSPVRESLHAGICGGAPGQPGVLPQLTFSHSEEKGAG